MVGGEKQHEVKERLEALNRPMKGDLAAWFILILIFRNNVINSLLRRKQNLLDVSRVRKFLFKNFCGLLVATLLSEIKNI